MRTLLFDKNDRVTGKAVVTGIAKYAGEHDLDSMTYGVLAGSTIASGSIISMDTKAAERAPGVIAVITHLNTPKVPSYDYAAGSKPISDPSAGGGLQIFNGPYIYFNGQPIALVIAGTIERAVYAASLVKATYKKAKPETDFDDVGKL